MVGARGLNPALKIAVLAPIAWRTPPRRYGPWEQVVALLVDGLVRRGVDVSLFATADSRTTARLRAVCARPYGEDPAVNPKVWECLHISELFEHAAEFDLIHNHFDFLPLSYSRLVSTPVVSTIHGFSSPGILPVYEKYDPDVHYVSISDADRSPRLHYLATIYHGIDLEQFSYQGEAGHYLVFFGRMHPDKGAAEAIQIARRSRWPLIMAGPVQDRSYFAERVEPFVDGEQVRYAGNVGPRARERLLGGAAALLHPIAFAEPFGLAVVEAMACGTPVVAFARGSMAELVSDGKTGFLVGDADEAVARLAQLGALSRAACRREVEQRFSAERMVDDYLEVYRRALAQRESYRPWGFYEVLCDRPDHKVKRITVYAGQRLSLQRHRRRQEHWYVVEGEARARLGERELTLQAGQTLDIPCGAAHRIAADETRDLVFIEVQRGSYFGEDDVERLEDDYGRT